MTIRKSSNVQIRQMEFKTESIKKDNKSHYTIIEIKTRKDITLFDVYVPKRLFLFYGFILHYA